MSTVPARQRVPLSAPQALPETSAVVWRPEGTAPTATVVLAPGAGTDITNPFLRGVGRGLARQGNEVVIFNFPYAEVGRRRPDPPARLERAYRDVLAHLRPAERDGPTVIGGRSMGGRIASHLAAEEAPCDGLLLLGYPLHPRRSVSERASPPTRLRTGHWPRLRLPTLFVQGDRDALCDLETFAAERAAHLDPRLTDVHVVAGADHGFEVRKRDERSAVEVQGEVVDVAARWLTRLGA